MHVNSDQVNSLSLGIGIDKFGLDNLHVMTRCRYSLWIVTLNIQQVIVVYDKNHSA